MRVRLGAALSSALTILIGLLTLGGLLLVRDSLGLSGTAVDTLDNITKILLELVTIVIALTVLLGVANLVIVHFRRTFTRQVSAVYSLFLLGGFGAAVGTRLLSDQEANEVLLETVLVSLESALAGLLFFALVYGAYRMMHRRVTWSNTVFVVALLIVLVGALPFSDIEALKDFREWLLSVPVSAGARGLLLGIALGTIVTGMRVLIGVDRSYRE
jgi:hypothetical protein